MYRYWKPEEIEFLKTNYTSLSMQELESHLNMDVTRIKAKASQLHLRRKPPLDKDTLVRLYIDRRHPAEVIGQQLERSKACILKNLHRYGIMTRKPGETLILQIDSEVLGKLYNEEGLSTIKIASLLHKNPASIFRHLKRHQIPLRSRALASKVSWQNSEYAIKVFTALNKHPTQPERQLQAILKSHFPQFKYNGDCRLGIVLAGMIPDFVNVNGCKEVIEVFGKRWHDMTDSWKRTELGRTMAYGSLGYRCLVIWDYELKPSATSEVIQKIARFTKFKPETATMEPSLAEGGFND